MDCWEALNLKSFKVNKKGQFTIIAALLVAVILVAAVITTYSSIRYSNLQDQPQTLSAIDEVNLALKKILGFTVGYYGSVLQVTGNTSYAKILASKYLSSGLDNIADIRPEWAPSFNVTNLDLKTNWFTNTSFSSGNFTIKYDLGGIGVSSMTYSASSRLDAQILQSPSVNQAALNITSDFEPLVDLGLKNFKFYKYVFSNSTWVFEQPSSVPTTFMNGVYLIDLPAGMNSSYVISIEDTRGLMVVASSFSRFTSTLTWNTTSVEQGFYYVDNANSNDTGTHGNFAAQQSPPDSVYDTLTEAASGVANNNYYPLFGTLLGSTTLANGTTNDLQSDNGVYMSFHSYGSTFGYTIKGGSTTALSDIRGSRFTSTQAGLASSISANLNSGSAFKAQTAIYSGDGSTRIDITEEKTFTSANGWVTFNFVSPPMLAASTNYVLVIWSNNSNVNIYRDTGTAQRFQGSGTYPNWPTTVADQGSQRTYSIYCTYSPNQYTAEAEFTGQSNTLTLWNDLIWTIDSSATTSGVSATFQLYNYQTGQYPTSGDGYMTATLGTTDSLTPQTITTNPTNFRNSTGWWKLKFTAVKSTTTQFDLKIDMVQFTSQYTNYALDLQEQWVSVNASNPRQDLCVKAGTLPTDENLIVQLQHGGSWINLMPLVSGWNNASLAPYINSETLTIRFVGSNDLTDGIQSSWDIDSVFIKSQPDISFLINLQESTFTVEILQNGTMRWLGQNLQLTTQELPIPPIPVKAIHVNQTYINGTTKEVSFQIEDWASEYRIPLGLTSNATVFGNRQMIVFLADNKVTDFTIWWDGSDQAVQTPLAYVNTRFHDSTTVLNNGRITLSITNAGAFTVTSQVVAKSTSSATNFMRINGEASTYGAGSAFVIYNGTVRDIIQQEAEWNNGADNCPNLYANIVLTLPAGVSYYTYQLRLMFINSSQERTISDLCPIRISTNFSPTQAQTENGTLDGFPIIQDGTGVFYNYTGGNWTAHHWSQLITGTGEGAGIMFSENANQKLYVFDAMAGNPTGSLSANLAGKLIELKPVNLTQVTQFKTALDITWNGAVATFDNTTPIFTLFENTTPTGLWILTEYSPTLTVTANS